MQGNVRSITAVELFHRIRDRRIDRCIVGKDVGNAGDIKIIRIAVFFILRNAARRKPFLWLLRILILLCPMPFSMCRIISPNRSPSRKWLRPPVIMSATSPSFSRSRWAFPPDSSFRRKNPIRLPSFSHPRICQSLKSQTLWDSAIPFIFPAFSKTDRNDAVSLSNALPPHLSAVKKLLCQNITQEFFYTCSILL